MTYFREHPYVTCAKAVFHVYGDGVLHVSGVSAVYSWSGCVLCVTPGCVLCVTPTEPLCVRCFSRVQLVGLCAVRYPD